MASDERVVLVASEHEEWARSAAVMSAELSQHLSGAKIAHIGSTSVPGLPSKPVVDLAVGVTGAEVVASARKLAQRGFDLEGARPDHAWLSYPNRSARAFVIHVFEFQSEEWRNRLRFRDILLTDTKSRETYLAVKREAAASANGWGEYTRAKASIVSDILANISAE